MTQVCATACTATHCRCKRAEGSKPQHRDVLAVAWVLVVIWPIGMVIGYALVLAPIRHTVLDDTESTALLEATTFFHKDYKQAYFWWGENAHMQRIHTCNGSAHHFACTTRLPLCATPSMLARACRTFSACSHTTDHTPPPQTYSPLCASRPTTMHLLAHAPLDATPLPRLP